MRISINGNVATVTSNINYAALKKVGPIIINDEAGNTKYAVAAGTVSAFSEKCANFTFANAEGKACSNVTCSENATTAMEELNNPVFTALNTYEAEVNAAIDEKMQARAALAEHITLN